MPCYKPMLAFPRSINPETGKVQYRFSEKFHDVAQLSEMVQLEDGKYYPVKALPCGKCIGCRLDYSKEWAVRCTLEMQDHDPNECYFVTLTYDDAHVPVSFYPKLGFDFWIEQNIRFVQSRGIYIDKFGNECYLDDTIGLVSDLCRSLTLRPDDMTEFVKRLRSAQKYEFGKEFRFYGCGEYGGRTHRPHYHMLLFGVRLPAPSPSDWCSKTGDAIVWQSKYLEKYWRKGNVIVGRCSFESAGYVARYMLKKQKGEYGSFYRTFNLAPEFTRMSRNPGIGMNYYDKYKKSIYENDEIFISTEKKGIKVKPPRFFDIRAADEFPDLFDQIKIERSDASYWSMVAKEEKSGLPMCQILANEELARKFKTKILNERSSAV